MFRKLRGSRYGMLSGLAAMALIIATVLVVGSGPSAAGIALGLVATVVGVAAISFLIAWIVRTDSAMTTRRPPPPSGHDPRIDRRPRPPSARGPRKRS